MISRRHFSGALLTTPAWEHWGAKQLQNRSLVEADKVMGSARSVKQDPAFQDVLRLIQEGNNASVSFVQRHYYLQMRVEIPYERARSILESMEGKYVSTPYPDGIRRVLIGKS